MNRPHDDALLDDVAMLAIGALTEEEAAPVRAHLASCDACRAEYARLRSVAAVLPLAGAETPAAPSALLKRRIMTAIVPEMPAQVRRTRSKGVLLPYLLAAACLAIAAIFGGLYASLLHASSDEHTTLADLMSPASQRYAVKDGEVVRHGDRIYLAMRGLPPPPPGKVYQAWTLPAGSKTVVPSVTFAPSGGSVIVRLPVNAASIAAVAVSVEPKGGSKQPTSTPMFVRPLRG